MNKFITNSNLHYFVVEVEIDFSKLENCIEHSSLETMFEFLGNAAGYRKDELEGNEIFINEIDKVQMQFEFQNVNSVEQFISQYEE